MAKKLRRIKIVADRIKKKKNPFKLPKYSKKAKYLHLTKRHSSEKRFKLYGQSAISIAILFILFLGYSISSSSYSAFFQSQIKLTIPLTEEMISDDYSKVRRLYNKEIKKSLRAEFPEITTRKDKIALGKLISRNASKQLFRELQDKKYSPNSLPNNINIWFVAAADADMFIKGGISESTPEISRKLKDKSIGCINKLKQSGKVRKVFNTDFFNNGDSRNPEQAGIFTALIGSLFTIIICLLVSVPLGIATAIYMEEFAPKNWAMNLVEININNLAAVPSIIYGLLGLAVYLNYAHLPRSSSLVGGLTLALLVLPVVIIATRQALRAVPDSIRQGATALGATEINVVFHHVLPYSITGIITGIILGIARALGETAPLLMIGMMAFIADAPKNFTDPTTSLPIQIYLWSDNPEVAFAEKTSAAILVLLAILVVVNVTAMYLRKKFEIKW